MPRFYLLLRVHDNKVQIRPLSVVHKYTKKGTAMLYPLDDYTASYAKRNIDSLMRPIVVALPLASMLFSREHACGRQ